MLGKFFLCRRPCAGCGRRLGYSVAAGASSRQLPVSCTLTWCDRSVRILRGSRPDGLPTLEIAGVSTLFYPFNSITKPLRSRNRSTPSSVFSEDIDSQLHLPAPRLLLIEYEHVVYGFTTGVSGHDAGSSSRFAVFGYHLPDYHHCLPCFLRVSSSV